MIKSSGLSAGTGKLCIFGVVLFPVLYFRRLHLPVNARDKNMFCRAIKLQSFDGQLGKVNRLHSIHSTFYLTKDKREERKQQNHIKSKKKMSEIDENDDNNLQYGRANFEV